MINLNKELLREFCNSDVKKLDIEMMPIQIMVNMVKELNPDFELELDGGETNGWEIDFWYNFSCLDTNFELSGSLHYGDFTLTKEV